MAEYQIVSDGATGQVLQPGGSADIVVSFSPSTIGTRTGSLVVTDNSGGTAGTTQTELLTGQGAVAAPVLIATPDTQFDFPDGTQGIQGASQNFVITNSGNANLVFGAVSITGANASEFIITGDSISNAIYPNNNGGILAVAFKPSGVGTRSATINIPNNDDGLHQIDIDGVGIAAGNPVLTVAPPSISYSGVVLGTPQSVTVTVSNTGTGSAPLVVSNISTDDARFAVVSDLVTGVSIPVGSNRTFQLRYTPGAGGENITANLTLTSNDGNVNGNTKAIGITGTSVAPAPIVSLNSTTLGFGSVTQGVTSSSLSFTITNTGNANLVIGTIVKAGTNAADFAVSVDGVSGQTVAPGTSKTASVTFTPSAASARSATLSIPHNAAGSPSVITLTGTGIATAPAAVVTPSTTLNFTAQVGLASSGQVVTITNTGNANLVITSATVTGANPTQFVITTDNATGQTIVPGGNRTVTVTYQPTTVATHTAFITFNDNAPGSPHRMQMIGVGTTPAFNLLAKTVYALYYPSFGKTSADFAGDSYQGWGGSAPAPLGSGNSHTYAPPNNIVSDYLPADYWSGAIGFPPSIYSSKDPVVLQAQCVEAINAGINVLLVSWNPPPAREDTIFPLMLTAAAAATTSTGKSLFIAPVIAPWGSASFTDPVNATAVSTGRSNTTLWHAVNYINSTYGSHSNFYRTNRVGGNYAGSSTAGLFFIEKPEIDNLTALNPITAAGTYWTTSTDAVHTVGSVPRGGIMIGGSGTFTAANLDQHHFDGGYNTSITPDTYDPLQYFRTWILSFKPTAIAIPFVSPGHSSWRSQEYPPKRVLRASGQFYDQQWNQALNGVALWDIGIRSFNGWRNGTQIEPAAVTGGDGT